MLNNDFSEKGGCGLLDRQKKYHFCIILLTFDIRKLVRIDTVFEKFSE